MVNIYIVYELGASSSYIDDTTLKNCLSGAVTLTKNAGIDKYGYSGYGIGFDRRASFSFPGGGFGQNVIFILIIREKTYNGTEIYKFKAKYSETVASPLCLGNISKDW